MIVDSKFVVVCGLRGKGKTALAVKKAVDHLKKGGTVFSNIVMTLPDNYKSFWSNDLNDISDMENCLLIIDEAHLKLSSRNWKDLTTLNHQIFAESRHFDISIIVISQSFKRLDTIVRELADEIWRVRRIGKLSWWTIWFFDDLDADGMPKTKIKSKGSWLTGCWFWHTQKLHNVYDDQQSRRMRIINGDRKWIKNVTGELPPLP